MAILFPAGASAVPPYDPDTNDTSASLPEPDIEPFPSITADAAIVINRSTGFVLGAKNPDLRWAPASTTKIMTALLAVESVEECWVSLADTVTVQSDVGDEGGGQIGLAPGIWCLCGTCFT